MTRDEKGNWGFGILALLFGIIILPLMLAREIYQCIKGNFPLEWSDIIRYSLIIAIFSGFHWFILEYFEFPMWTWF